MTHSKPHLCWHPQSSTWLFPFRWWRLLMLWKTHYDQDLFQAAAKGLNPRAFQQTPCSGSFCDWASLWSDKRWRPNLFTDLEVETDSCSEVILACAFLHNICVMVGDTMEEDILPQDPDPPEPQEHVDFRETTGFHIRERLSAQVSALVQLSTMQRHHDYTSVFSVHFISLFNTFHCVMWGKSKRNKLCLHLFCVSVRSLRLSFFSVMQNKWRNNGDKQLRSKWISKDTSVLKTKWGTQLTKTQN